MLAQYQVGELSQAQCQMLIDLKLLGESWQIANSDRHNSQIPLVYFKSEKFLISNYDYGVEWMGRYF